MRKLMSIFLTLMLFAVFSFGCAGVSRNTKVRCPKCGTIFTIDEGLKEQRLHGGPGGQ